MTQVTAQIADPTLAAQIVDDAIATYFAQRRARLPEFLERTYSIKGAAGLNACAFGHDLWRGPLNVALAGPDFALKATESVLSRLPLLSGKVELPNLHLKTDVARELEWRIHTDLLELPFEQPCSGRKSSRDALGEIILSDPRLDAIWHPVLADHVNKAHDPELRKVLHEAIETYQSSRAATGEIVNLGLSLTIGALITHQLTPGALTLAPSVAQATAEKIAIANFTLGPTLGSLWYQFAPAPASVLASASASGIVLGVIAGLVSLSGFVVDPLQHKLGIHNRRLSRMIDALEDNFASNTANRYFIRDHYLARLLDMIDFLSAAWAHAR